MIQLNNEQDSQRLAQLLATQLSADTLPKSDAIVIFLQGTLGAGKTTLVRYLLHALGHQGAVKSPTYGLLEEYQLQLGKVCHFDLYRLNSSEELEYIGIREYLAQSQICLFEWAEHGQDLLPVADLQITLNLDPNNTQRRHVNIHATKDFFIQISEQIENEF